MAAKFLPYLLAGISVGGQYALIAIGYTMVYGILRLINFAHGDIFTVAGFLMVFAWGMTKAADMQTIRTYYSLLSFVNESEDAERLRCLRQFGLTDEGIQSLPLRPENRAYVDYMIDTARNSEGAAECMMACLPCMLSYSWIFQKLLKEHPAVQDAPYGVLVADYAGRDYEEACHDWAAFAEKTCEGLSPERLARCREIFHACSVYELDFWAMAALPRSDL